MAAIYDRLVKCRRLRLKYCCSIVASHCLINNCDECRKGANPNDGGEKLIDLILWRHAEAEPGDDDPARPLTGKGLKQAARMASWLERVLPDRCRILVSPTRRTVQTAEALQRKFKIVPETGCDATAERILAAANWPNSREPVVIIGHQPSLGLAASLLITGTAQYWTVRKANVWWLVSKESDESGGAFIKTIMTPELALK